MLELSSLVAAERLAQDGAQLGFHGVAMTGSPHPQLLPKPYVDIADGERGCTTICGGTHAPYVGVAVNECNSGS